MSTPTPAPYHPQSAFATPTPQSPQQQQLQQQSQNGYMQQQPVQNTQQQQAQQQVQQQQVQPQQFQHPQQHQNAAPAPLQHTQTFPSMAEQSSVSSIHSGRSSFSGVSIMTPPSTVASPAWNSGNTPVATVQPTPSGNAVNNPIPGGPACNHCKNAIQQNVSVYLCLICSTTNVLTQFCVWCYTAGAAETSHPHDKSYYVTDSDLLVQPSKSAVPADLWTQRKNVTGRIWYTHKTTGYKTHIQPVAAEILLGLPPGWQERKTVEGHVYYFNSNTKSSSWTKPANGLPDGWKELKTPDMVPFYVNESLGLTSWERPGQQPQARPALPKRPTSLYGSMTAANRSSHSAASTSATMNGPPDLPNAGFKAVTKAAAKLTGQGVMIGAKQMGKLGKKKNLKKMGKFMTSGLLDVDYEGDSYSEGSGDDDGDYEGEDGEYYEG